MRVKDGQPDEPAGKAAFQQMKQVTNTTLKVREVDAITAIKGVILLAPKGPADLKPDAKLVNKVLQMDGDRVARELPAEHQLITFGWDDLHVSRPDLVYMPEKDRLLLHFLMRHERYSALIYSDDRGKTWSTPQYLKDDRGIILQDSIAMAYLGNGNLIITTGESDSTEGAQSRVFSSDYGATWNRREPNPPAPNGLSWYNWCQFYPDMDPRTGKLARVCDPGYTEPITHKVKMERAFAAVPKLVTLPEEWHWRHDPDNRGLTEVWHKQTAFDRWSRMIQISKPWTQQGEPLGVGWYATAFEMTESGGAPLALLFNAVDGNCDIFIDGEKVGEKRQVDGDDMWEKPFPIFLDRGLAPGRHRLVVRVEKDCWEAGIWKPVAIAEKSRLVIPPPEEDKVLYAPVYIRYSHDGGHTWPDVVQPAAWKDGASGVGVSEVALCRAANGDMVAACRIKFAKYMQRHTVDHYAGLGTSLSKDNGHTWSKINVLYDYGRMQPSLTLMPNGDIVLTYVVRMGALKEEDRIKDDDGYAQWSIEAIVSRDHGVTWDLKRKYVLGRWSGDNQAQSTTTALLPDGSLVTAFGSGYRSRPEKVNPCGPVHEVCLVRWRP